MSFALLEAIEQCLQAGFADYLGINPVDNMLVAPHFSLGSLPPKRSERGLPVDTQGHDFPFIVPRPMSAEDNEQVAMARPEEQIQIICGVYVDPKTMTVRDGVFELMRITNKVRTTLLTLENRMLDARYELQLPLKIHYGVDHDSNQPHPYYYSSVTCKWSTPPVTQQLTSDEEVRIYGSGYPE